MKWSLNKEACLWVFIGQFSRKNSMPQGEQLYVLLGLKFSFLSYLSTLHFKHTNDIAVFSFII